LFRVKHGYAFKGEFFDTTGSHVLLTPGNFGEAGGFRELGKKQRYYTGDVPEEFVLDEGDVLIAMTEQMEGLLGSSVWIRKGGCTRTDLDRQIYTTFVGCGIAEEATPRASTGDRLKELLRRGSTLGIKFWIVTIPVAIL
jgi:hypothetical protein